MQGTTIRDAPLITYVDGTERIPVSNGTGKPAAVTIDQIYNYVSQTIPVVSPDKPGLITPEQAQKLEEAVTFEVVNDF